MNKGGKTLEEQLNGDLCAPDRAEAVREGFLERGWAGGQGKSPLEKGEQALEVTKEPALEAAKCQESGEGWSGRGRGQAERLSLIEQIGASAASGMETVSRGWTLRDRENLVRGVEGFERKCGHPKLKHNGLRETRRRLCWWSIEEPREAL